jgi:hypothetical protein
VNTTISQKRDAQGAGYQSAKDGNGSVGNGGNNCRGKGNGGGVCCGEGRGNGGSGDVDDDRLVLILAGSVCNVWDLFRYKPTLA